MSGWIEEGFNSTLEYLQGARRIKWRLLYLQPVRQYRARIYSGRCSCKLALSNRGSKNDEGWLNTRLVNDSCDDVISAQNCTVPTKSRRLKWQVMSLARGRGSSIGYCCWIELLTLGKLQLVWPATNCSWRLRLKVIPLSWPSHL